MIIPVGSSAKKELLCVYTWWLTSTSGDINTQTRRLDYQGAHYSEYIDDSASSTGYVTVLKDCAVEVTVAVRIANNTRREQSCQATLVRDNMTEAVVGAVDNDYAAATSKDIDEHSSMNWPKRIKANDRIYFWGYNNTATATVRTVAIWAYV